jgi:hypothetical protein
VCSPAPPLRVTSPSPCSPARPCATPCRVAPRRVPPWVFTPWAPGPAPRAASSTDGPLSPGGGGAARAPPDSSRVWGAGTDATARPSRPRGTCGHQLARPVSPPGTRPGSPPGTRPAAPSVPGAPAPICQRQWRGSSALRPRRVPAPALPPRPAHPAHPLPPLPRGAPLRAVCPLGDGMPTPRHATLRPADHGWSRRRPNRSTAPPPSSARPPTAHLLHRPRRLARRVLPRPARGAPRRRPRRLRRRAPRDPVRRAPCAPPEVPGFRMRRQAAREVLGHGASPPPDLLPPGPNPPPPAAMSAARWATSRATAAPAAAVAVAVAVAVAAATVAAGGRCCQALWAYLARPATSIVLVLLWCTC